MKTRKQMVDNATGEWAVKASVALSYVPCVLGKLKDDDTAHMFAEILQAMFEAGYENGFQDGTSFDRRWNRPTATGRCMRCRAVVTMLMLGREPN